MSSVIGHRGWPARFPDNTLSGLLAAATVADAVEVDVRRCADGKLVLSHDPDLAGFLVSAHDWAFLGELDLGGGHHPALLDEAIGSLPETPVMLEVKNLPHQPGFEPDHRIGQETAARARPGDFVTSFHWPTIDAVRRQFSDVATGLIVGELADLPQAVEHCLHVGHSAVVPDVRLVRDDKGRQLVSETDLDVYVWTVNDPVEAEELAGIGVTGIITDDPGLISSIRESQ
ncbi:MAG TPA: glycerophosphodiester phosphodiesterase [Acidimicrobiia bacterium]|nr:glycerophosphodiester phosphodiesterase [Acidimicrobiia bacterium]